MENIETNFCEVLEGEKLNQQFESGKTYAVKGILRITQNLTIPENVTLIFLGGRFETTAGNKVTISGTNTRLKAPICTIFGKGINVEGSWDIDRAYPQWFEVENTVNEISIKTEEQEINGEMVLVEKEISTEHKDHSSSINKAITMKGTGVVFFKSAQYNIASPIIANTGIQLIGENSQSMNNSSSYTIFRPVVDGKGKFNGDYLLYINSYTTPKNFQYIDQSTIIDNICFTNWRETIPTQKCIYAGGGVHLNRIVWYNFLQGVKYTHTYNDTRSITNCSFKTDRDINNISEDYAFDTGWLGDAFRFEHNAIHSTCNGKALKIDHCGGASIQGNIINGDVLIEGSKAIVFNANHCEGGMQVTIEDSSVVTNNNYFHKGTVPNITIKSSGNADKSVVSMNNDMFMFLETSVNEYNEAEDKEAIPDKIDNISIYDICIDRHTILDITNVYRYESIVDFYKMYPCGISLCEGRIEKVDEKEITIYEPIKEFNNYSYIASCKSQMLSNYCLNVQATIRDTKDPAISNVQHSNSICWFKDNGFYRYYYQILWDETRGIKKTSSLTSTSDSIFPVKWFADNVYTDVHYKYNGKGGVAIAMPKDLNGNCSMVRLIREKIENSQTIIQEVYIPVCGTQYLYDNGISVCGYKWKGCDTTNFNLNETSDKNMEMFRIIDGNVECFTKREGGITPTKGWKCGDVIHHIGNNPSTIIVSEDINQ